MVTDLLYIVFHFVACLLFFWAVQRPMFCCYNRGTNPQRMTMHDLLQIYRHGYKTDLKVAAYMTMPCVVIMFIHTAVPFFIHTLWLFIIDVLLSFAVALACVADTALYKFWKFKIDKSVFAYLRSLKGAFASVSMAYIITALAAVLLVWCILLGMLLSVCYWHAATFVPEHHNWIVSVLFSLVFLLIGGLLFLITRGVKRRPETTSIAFYSTNPYYNHCALNPLFNLIYSFSIKDDFDKQFQEFDNEYCKQEFAPLFPTHGTPKLQVLNTTRPNVLFIVWESLCSYFVGELGGRKDCCVNIDRLTKEGLWFPHFYAGSFRTDRALVCSLSGYLAQPTMTIIRYVKKLPNLPALPRTLRDLAGYETSVYHGGDLSIFHKSDYYLASGHNQLHEQKDYPKSAPSCSWGIHDGYMFDRIFEDIQQDTLEGRQWYRTFQTLSSHEPFEVPYDRIKDDKMANTFAYVDECFGRFVEKLKQTPAWDNLLIIMTGDHGINLNGDNEDTESTHLPLLMIGGAVKNHMTIDTVMAQTDIAATLLGQMNIKHDDFTFSRDVLADTYTHPFAYHAFNNGFIIHDAQGHTKYDLVSQTAIENPDEKRERTGKIILQTLYQDISKR